MPDMLGGKRELVRRGEGRRHGAGQSCPRRPRPDDGLAGRPRRHHPHGLDLVHQWRRVPLGRRLGTRGLADRHRERGHLLGDRSPGEYSVYVSEYDGQDDWSFYGETQPMVYTQDSTIQVTVPLHTLALDVKYANGSSAPANVELTATTPRRPAGSTQAATPTVTSPVCPPSWWRTTRPVTATAGSGSWPTPDRPAPSWSRATRRRTPPCSMPECTSREPSPTGWATPHRRVHRRGVRRGRSVAGQLDGDRCRRPLRPRTSSRAPTGSTSMSASSPALAHYYVNTTPIDVTTDLDARPRARDRHADRPRPHAGWPARAVQCASCTATARRRVRRSSSGRTPTAWRSPVPTSACPGRRQRMGLQPRAGPRRGALLQHERLASGRRRRDHRGGQPRDHHHRSGDRAGDHDLHRRHGHRAVLLLRRLRHHHRGAQRLLHAHRGPSGPERRERRRERRDRGELRLPACGDALRGRPPGART